MGAQGFEPFVSLGSLRSFTSASVSYAPPLCASTLSLVLSAWTFEMTVIDFLSELGGPSKVLCLSHCAGTPDAYMTRQDFPKAMGTITMSL